MAISRNIQLFNRTDLYSRWSTDRWLYFIPCPITGKVLIGSLNSAPTLDSLFGTIYRHHFHFQKAKLANQPLDLFIGEQFSLRFNECFLPLNISVTDPICCNFCFCNVFRIGNHVLTKMCEQIKITFFQEWKCNSIITISPLTYKNTHKFCLADIFGLCLSNCK